jgi:hypothetical protein
MDTSSKVMRLLTGDDLWPTISKHSKAAKSTRAAISHFTSAAYLHFNAGDVLIVDASNHAIAKGQTSAKTLSHLHGEGVRIFSCPNLHAKVLTCDAIAFVGSANASESSVKDLIEGVLMTDDSHAVSAANAFIEQIKIQSHLIDSPFVARILEIKVLPRDTYTGPGRKKIDVSGERTWLVNATDVEDGDYADEESDVETAKEGLVANSPNLEDISWTRWIGKSRFRQLARPADNLILISKSPGEKDQPYEVFPPLAVLHRQDVGIWTRIYQTDDLTGKLKPLTWRQFLKLWKKAALKGLPTPHSMREVSKVEAETLRALWPISARKTSR